MTERANQRFDISVGTIVRHEGKNEPCLSLTLSTTGMSVSTQKRWPIGTPVEVEIVHESVRMKSAARVANHTKSGVGLQFVDMSQEFELKLAALLAKYVPAQQGRVNVAADRQEGVVEWEAPEGEEVKRSWWKAKRTKTRLIDLSLDGAAIVGKKPPEVGAQILVTLHPPKSHDLPDAEVQSLAKVVRHTARGFAVQFVTPSQAFRRAVSEIRKAARSGDT
jgi:hypothetical protein